jgi:hypothetical protein
LHGAGIKFECLKLDVSEDKKEGLFRFSCFIMGGGGLFYRPAPETVLDVIDSLIKIEFFLVIIEQAHLHGKGDQLAEPDTQQTDRLTLPVEFVKNGFGFRDQLVVQRRVINDFLS